MKRFFGTALCLIFTLQIFLCSAYAIPDWPADTGVQSSGGIVVDADSGAVLFGQNIHVAYPPASITKLLTALVVIENASLDETVVFSHDAVYDVESGSGNALSLEEGDRLSVEDCLYAMLLRSSNQAANALAEHVGGSRDGFVDMMNQKAAELGCTESHWANPSGLNDETQLTTAYDMSIIARAAFQNETLLEIDSSLSYSLPATINCPDGQTVSAEHRLLITEDSSSDTYYPAAVAGKTGYTSLAGQTLVTYAQEDGRSLVCVILKSNLTHYSDTISLLEFGFDRFQNVEIAAEETAYTTGETAVTVGGQSYEPSDLVIEPGAVVTLPTNGSFADLESELVTDLPADAPSAAVGLLRYRYNQRVVGQAYLMQASLLSADGAETVSDVQTASEQNGTPDSSSGDSSGFPDPHQQGGDSGGFITAAPSDTPVSGSFLSVPVLIILLIVLAAAAGSGYLFWKKNREQKALEERRARRRKRLEEDGISEEEFQKLLEEKLSGRPEKSEPEPNSDPKS